MAGMVHGVRVGFARIECESRKWAGGLAGAAGTVDEVFADHGGRNAIPTELRGAVLARSAHCGRPRDSEEMPLNEPDHFARVSPDTRGIWGAFTLAR